MKMSACTKCPLHKGRTNVVLPRGTGLSGVMFLGEAPGREEDETGRPFVGKAGKLLSQYLGKFFPAHNGTGGPPPDEGLRLTEEDFWITNAIHCRPPDNRTPEREELRACAPWLDKEIARVKPWLIVCLGKSAALRMFPGADFSKYTPWTGHVKWSNKYTCLVMFVFHPSYVMRKSQDAEILGAYHRHFKWIRSAAIAEHWWTDMIRREAIEKQPEAIPVTPEDDDGAPF